MTKRTKKTEQTAKLTYAPAMTHGEAESRYRHTVKDDDTASQMNKFLQVMRTVLALRGAQGFTVKDVYYFAQPYALEARACAEMFDRWKTFQIKLGKLQAQINPLWENDDQFYVAIG